jgi:hypothetical protein
MEIRKIFEYALGREYEGKRFFEQNAERLTHAAAIDAFKSYLQKNKNILSSSRYNLISSIETNKLIFKPVSKWKMLVSSPLELLRSRSIKL